MTRDRLAGLFEVYRVNGRAVHFHVRGEPGKIYFLYIESDGNAVLEKRHPAAARRPAGARLWVRMPKKMIPYVVMALWPEWTPPDNYRLGWLGFH